MTRSLIWCLFFGFFTLAVSADSRRVIEYDYDGAGNTISIESSLSTNPPAVTNLSPSAIRIGKTIAVIATGTDLKNAQVSADDPNNLIVANATTTETEVSFQLTALDGATIGPHNLTFATSLGSINALIDVQPRAPVLRVAPIPLVLASSGTPRTLDIRLNGPDIFDNSITLTIDDPNIVSASTTVAVIPAGQVVPTQPITLSGLVLGSTNITISSTTLQNFNLTATVSASFVQPPEGTQVNAYADPLGVELTPLVVTPDLAERGPIVAQLQVVKESNITPDDNARTFATQPLGVVLGSSFESLAPTSVRANTGPVSLVITGQGLESIDQVTINPADGVTLGASSVSGDGLQVTVPLTVDADVLLSERRVSISAAGVAVKPSQPNAGQLFIGGELPEIISIDPVVVSRLSTTTLRLTGAHFEGAKHINITPTEGVLIGAQLTVNADNTEIAVPITVEEYAALGPRVVSIVTATGESSQIASAANTLTIANGLDGDITPISAQPVGVVFNDTGGQGTTDRLIASNPLNILLGASLTGLSPKQQAVGSNFTLTVNGTDLNGVTDVSFSPADGVTIEAPTIAPDGQSLTVDVTIAVDAPATLRQVVVTATGTRIRAAAPDIDRFRITPPQPIIDSMTPIFLLADGASSDITIRGQLFDEVQAVRVLPADDITVNTPSVNAAGDTITVALTALASAQTGPRVIVVETPGGATSAVPNAANTLHVVSQVVGVRTPILSAALGIEKETDTQPPGSSQELLVTSDLLGVELQVDTPAPTRNIDVIGVPTGVTLGPVGLSISPTAASIDTALTLTIDGFNLDDVTNVAFLPADGITLPSGFTVSGDGSRITLPISVDAAAPQTVRQVVLTTATGDLRFADSANSRIRIAGEAAVIDSIEPIQQVPGTTFDLLIRGSNFGEVSAVKSVPANGILFNTPIVNPEETEITVTVVIELTATSGPRAITVTTPAGTTSDTPAAESTFTVLIE